MKRLLAALLCLACLIPGCAAAEGSEGVLYRVQYQDNTVYLLGSIHIGASGMYPVSDTMRAAIDGADAFLFECDTDSSDAYVTTMKATTYTGDERLPEHLSSDTHALVQQSAEKLGLPPTALDSFKPWAVMSTFSLYLSAELMGEPDLASSQEYGVEAYVKGLVGEREVGYLETLDEQLGALESFSPALQDYLVASTCRAYLDPAQATGSDADMADWPAWWRDGRIDLFADSYLSSYREPGYEALCDEYHQKLLQNRNVVMADGVERALTDGSGRTVFATLGLLHLVLPEGSVPALLADRGYTVEQISRSLGE